jgi:dienelactone hydrolase
MRALVALSAVTLCVVMLNGRALAQRYREPDRGQPGDAAMQLFLSVEADRLHASFAEGTGSLAEWEAERARWRDEYFYMLGLAPLPERTPLHATITGTLEGDGFVVEMLHFQSRPGLYVTANLYRPADGEAGERRPAVLYVCGHSGRGRDGNKTAYQSHGMWFARHGYVCLVVDTLQLGEIAAVHHGTSRFGRWWWHSRGYTPAGVECWNGIRAIDYLVSRDDVDPQRIAVTGISGGGAASFWIAAADERLKVAVPVSGMADLPSYIGNSVISGHCDCMFLYNTFRWPWTRIAALIAPRPLLFVNSDADPIFPMDANDRVSNRLEHVYRLYGAGDVVDSVVSVGGHAYREDIRKAAYRFINMHLKGDASVVMDSEIDLVEGSGSSSTHPIEPRRLRVFPTDADIPSDQQNTVIDEQFVPIARPELPQPGAFESWRDALLQELRRVSFRAFPREVSAANVITSVSADTLLMETERGIRVRLLEKQTPDNSPQRVLLVVRDSAGDPTEADWFEGSVQPSDGVFVLEPRGIGASRWTSHSASLFYVERSLALVGQTADAGRVRDIIAAASYLKTRYGADVPVHVVGEGAGAVLAAYAAALTSDIDGAVLAAVPPSLMDESAPAILNALRVCDVPDVLGLIAPRPLALHNVADAMRSHAEAIYQSAGGQVTGSWQGE